MTVNVETGKHYKEFTLNRGYWCIGCTHYYDESDFVCKCGCSRYFPKR